MDGRTTSESALFHRLELLVGPEAIEKLSSLRVIVFGLGGVGSWCAESLIRSGVGDLTLVDSDRICVTNINRQLHATIDTIGKSKALEMKRRLSRINPQATLTAIEHPYRQQDDQPFQLDDYDCVVDAIDSLNSKVDLLSRVMAKGVTVFSALGASCKLDPTRVKAGSFWEVRGCPLGKHMRKRLRNRGATRDFICVYSDENLPGYQADSPCGNGNCFCPAADDRDPADAFGPDWCSQKKQINGSAVHVTATFGFVLAGLVVRQVVDSVASRPPKNTPDGCV